MRNLWTRFLATLAVCALMTSCSDDDDNNNETVSCTDGVKNGDEEGVDCGGACQNKCETEPTCNDGVKNGDEEGVDCGGTCKNKCETEPTCNDGVKNGDEEGVDCGGACQNKCETEPTCNDGVKNGDEEGVDCGGACQNKCAEAGAPCGSAAHGQKYCNPETHQLAICNNGKFEDLTGDDACQAPEICYFKNQQPLCGHKSCGCEYSNCESSKDLAYSVKSIRHGELTCSTTGDAVVECIDGNLSPIATGACQNGQKCVIVEAHPVCKQADCGTIPSGTTACNQTGTQKAVCTNGELVEFAATDEGACEAGQICVYKNDTATCETSANNEFNSIPDIHAAWERFVNFTTCPSNTTDAVEAKIKISGYVTALNKTKSIIYIQDPTITSGIHAGIMIYGGQNGASITGIDLNKLEIGVKVEVEADGLSTQDCQLRVDKTTNPIKMTFLDAEYITLPDEETCTYDGNVEKCEPVKIAKEIIEPIVLHAKDVPTDKLHNDYNGTLVRLNDLTAIEKDASTGWFATDETGKTKIASRIIIVNSILTANKKYDIVGIVADNATTKNPSSGVQPRADTIGNYPGIFEK